MVTAESAGTAWTRLLRRATVVEALVLGVAAAVLTDVEAAGYTLVVVVLLWLHSRRPAARVVVLTLGLIALPVSFFGVSAALANLDHTQHIASVLQPAVMGGSAVVAMVAAAAVLLRRTDERMPVVLAVAVGLAVVATVGVAYNLSRAIVDGPGADVTLVAEDVAFAPTELRADGDGERFILLALNRDLFWHTVTIPELDVDLRLAVGANEQAVIEAPPGTYTFYCAVPGHRQVGMEGTLTVG